MKKSGRSPGRRHSATGKSAGRKIGKKVHSVSGRKGKRHHPTGKKDEKRIFGSVIVISVLTLVLVSMVVMVGIMSDRKSSGTSWKETGLKVSYEPLNLVLVTNPSRARDKYVENLMIELAGRFRNRIRLEFAYSVERDDAEVFTRLCIGRKSPESAFSYIYCSNKYPSEKDRCFNTYVKNSKRVQNCIETERTSLLDENSANLRNLLGKEATGEIETPLLFIDGKKYQGGFSETEISRKICSAIFNPPPVCGIIPSCFSDADCPRGNGLVAVCKDPGTSHAECRYFKATPVDVVLLMENDWQKIDYATSKILNILKSEIRNVRVRSVALTSDEGRGIAENNGIVRTPALLLPLNISSHPKFHRIENALERRGEYYVLFP